MKQIFISISILLFSIPNISLAISDPANQLQPAGIFTELGTKIDQNIEIRDSSSKLVKIKELLNESKPLIIVPTYYRCPRLCGLVLGGVAQLVKDLDLKLGKDYKIVTYSFNPIETAEEAQAKKQHYTKVLQQDTKQADKQIEGWEFYLADQGNARLLNNQLGFGVVPDQQDFAHSAAIFIISPNGQVSQYFSNIDYDPKDVRLALVEASEGKIGNIIDQVMLFCFQFDSNKGQYNWAVFRLLKLVGALSIILLGGTIFFYLYKEKILSAKTRK